MERLMVRIVTPNREIEVPANEMGLNAQATDADFIRAAANHLDTTLTDYTVSRQGSSILVSPAPEFG